MGRFVLGILVVVLLQIVFLLRTSIDEVALRTPNLTPPPVVRTSNLNPVEQQRTETDIAQAEPGPADETEIAAPRRNDSTPSLKETRATGRRTPRRVTPRIENRLPDTDLANVVITYPERSQPIRSRPVRVDTRSSRGYTMALADYSGTSASAYMKTKEVRGTKNRSFFSKTYSVLVKKPWKGMKYVASKMY